MPAKRLRPQDVAPIEPAEFGVAFQAALDAGQSANGAPSSTPWERARRALERRFSGDDEKIESADSRFRAVMDLFTRDVLVDWTRGSGGAAPRMEIHPAVLDVASRMRLAGNGKFPVRKFLDDVSRTARSNYADLEDWPLPDED